ncbi:META domain-containing protein [Maribacter sp. ACAM166]|uniref:META domain-containing protein n=1 Tax=Maribacter sp. ACAM166 TaxID=2508996 RepID=UPI0010FCEECA|nr:META domain-containing protein [Maribacter sp. ACAM166]TLP71785.1 META domain-containing protein [Maribacter sp. ACAM166]
MNIKLTLLTILGLVVVGCNSNKKTNSPTTDNHHEKTMEKKESADKNTIENSKWVLTTLEGQDMYDREQNEQIIYFTLNSEENSINGNSGCNTFMGTYKSDEGNRISFSQLASTRMMCPDAKINESHILKVFELTDNFTIQNGVLSLNVGSGAPFATFKKAAIENLIVEKYWKLKTLEGKDISMVDNQVREIYFTLKSQDNTVTGFAGCNTLGGEFTLEEGNRIHFSNMLTTLRVCPDVAINESEFLKVFELADNYTINNDVLSLNVGRRAPLAVFEAVYMKL